MAGRLTPSSLRSCSIDTAISAPVLPHDTAAEGFPRFHRPNCAPHRGRLAVAHHVAGLGIHRHNLVGVADVAAVGNLAFGDQARQFHLRRHAR